MNNLPITFLIFCVVFTFVLQVVSVWLGKFKEAAAVIDDRSSWIAKDGTMFDEYEVKGIQGSQMVFQHEAEQSRVPLSFLPQGLTLHPKS